MQKLRALITGGAGFIGSHLAERMLTRGDDVIVLDDLSTGSLDNVAQLRQSQHVDCVVGSAGETALVESRVDNGGVIIRLAAAGGVGLALAQPAGTIENHRLATGVVLA